ncbi:MAG: hypothetical protein KBS38_04005 [Bacteroidales bacterium]|nr:hypothetical protein [Candidatus Cacconaster caballi]
MNKNDFSVSTDQRPAPMRFFNRFICFVPAILSVVFLVGCAKSIELEKPKPGSSEPKEKEQETIPAPRLSVSTINLDQEGGTATLEVVADTTWKAFCGAADDWNHGVSISPDSGQKGSTTVTITASDKKVELEHFLIVFYNYLPTQGQQSHLYIEKEGTDKKVLEAISQWLVPESGECEIEMFHGRIFTLKLPDVDGKAPRILSELDSLRRFELLSWKGHEGDFSIFKKFPVLEWLNLGLSDVNEIPKEFLTLTQLKRFGLFSVNLSFSGSIPEEFKYFPDLEYLEIGPGLGGPVPEWVLSSKFWPNSRSYMMKINDFDPLSPSITFNDYSTGKEYNLADEVSSHKYTMIVAYSYGQYDIVYPFAGALGPYIEQMYQAYKDDGLQVIGIPQYSIDDFGDVVPGYGPFEVASYPTEAARKEGLTELASYGQEYDNYYSGPADLTILDSDGKICISTNQTTDYSAIADFLKKEFRHGYLYESKDYSRDGEVRLVQKASKGRGIDLIFLGNCFSDRQIADGTFDKVMNGAVNAFFYEDPMYSMRDLFNIYIITTVSPNEYYGPGTRSAIDLRFDDPFYGGRSSIWCNYDQIYKYSSTLVSSYNYGAGRYIVVNYLPARKGVSTQSTYDVDNGGKYSEGGFDAFLGVRNGVDMVELVTHEACGHGIGKLADVYEYPEDRMRPSWLSHGEEKLKERQKQGFYTNFSLTPDPEAVPWSRFLKDSRYDGEGLGVYPIGTKNFAGYRSSDSVMGNSPFTCFSAPCRYTLWRAISYLAYGDKFEDNYENFVEMDTDARNYRIDLLADKDTRWYHPDREHGGCYYWFEPISNDFPLD